MYSIEKRFDLIDSLVKADTRKLSSYEAFVEATRMDDTETDAKMSLRKFAVERSNYLLSKQ